MGCCRRGSDGSRYVKGLAKYCPSWRYGAQPAAKGQRFCLFATEGDLVLILAILQARTSSSRLPGKVLKPLLDKPMLARQIERLKRCRSLDRLIVATSTEQSDDAIVKVAQQEGLETYRGSLNDVLDRYYQAANAYDATWVVRLTADCPLTEPRLVDFMVQLTIDQKCDFATNGLIRSYPRGLDTEVMTISTLEVLWRETTDWQDREHVTPLVYAHPERFRIASLAIEMDLSALRWTVDYQADFDFVAQIYQALYPTNPAFGMEDILRYLILNGTTRIFERGTPVRTLPTFPLRGVGC